jgi:DNA mismatch repair protein MutS
MLAARANNYLAAVVLVENQAGVAYADISTGEFRATSLSGVNPLQALRDELMRLGAAEVLVPEGLDLGNGLPGSVTTQPSWKSELGRCEQTLLGTLCGG